MKPVMPARLFELELGAVSAIPVWGWIGYSQNILMKTCRTQRVQLAAYACPAAGTRNELYESALRAISLLLEFISLPLPSGGVPMNRSLGWSGDAMHREIGSIGLRNPDGSILNLEGVSHGNYC